MKATVDWVLPKVEDGKEHPSRDRDRARVYQLFHEAVGVEGQIRGTAWAGLQAWSEWADHHRPMRAGEGDPAKRSRLNSIWFGRGAQLKRTALNAIVNEANLPLAAA